MSRASRPSATIRPVEALAYEVTMATLTERARYFSAHQARGRHRRRRPSASGWLREFTSESLIRNSAFLAVNIVLTAVGGFAAVSLLTHLYTEQAVGLSATALSAGTLIAAITQFGVNFALPRFLPTSAHRRDLINTALTVTIIATLVGTSIFLALPVATKFFVLGGGLFAVLFVVGTSLDAGETQLEAVFIADRSADKITIANIATNVVKLAAPAAFLFLGGCGAYASRIVVGTVTFIVLAIILGKRGHKFRATISLRATRDLRQFSAGAYIGGLLGSLPLMVLPIIILSRFGPSQSAYWYTAMSIAALLYQMPGVVSRVLLAEVAQRTSERRYLVYRAARLMGAIMLPAFVVAYITAPLVLVLFGKQYAVESLGPLRWLILAGLPSVINSVSGTILYLAKKTFVIAAINGTGAVMVPLMAATWAHNLSGVALCWLIGEIPTTALFTLFAVHSLRQVRYRWEDLGGGELRSSPWNARRGFTPDSQQEGLEMLFRLATHQVTRPRGLGASTLHDR